MTDRKNDTSTALTEVRTVHSRAASAIERLESTSAGENYRLPDVEDWAGPDGGEDFYVWFRRAHILMADPDHDAMIAALEQVTELLAPWQGKRRRR